MSRPHIPRAQYDLPLQGVGALLGLKEKLTFNDNFCALDVGDVAIALQCDEANERIVMSASLAALPQVVEPALLEQLLALNLYWQSGATVCMEPGSRVLLMLRPEPVHNITSRYLLSSMEQFAANVADGRRTIAARLDP